MRTLISLTVLLAAISAHDVGAQIPELGDRVDVVVGHPFAGPHRRVGSFERVVGDTIWVRLDGAPRPFAIADAEPRVAVGGTKLATGALIGVLVGGLSGALIGHTSYEPTFSSGTRCVQRRGAMMGSMYGATCYSVTPTETSSRGLETAVHAAAGAALGGVVGALLGLAVRDWVPVDVEALHAGPDGVAVTIRR